MKKLIIFCSGIFLSTLSFSQDRLGAFCPEPINEEMQNSIGIQTENLDANSSIKKVSATIIKVPIVFHILTDDPTGVSNISDCIIKNQVDILNNCFRKKLGTQGYNTNPVGADTDIEFFLPCKDGNGNSTTGIIRTTTPNCNYTTLNNTTQLSNIKSASSGSNNFPNNKFLNIWVVKTMPNSNNVRAQAWWGNTSTGANRVGVIIHYSYLGSKNSGCQNLTYLDITGFQAYDMGATLVHEVGHYFSLQHTYGTCGSYTDGCADTPEVSGLPNALCGTNNNTKGVCTAGQTRMWQNYLDYTDDACMNIFTNDQKTKMRNYINATTNYINLTSATNIDAVSCASSSTSPTAAITSASVGCTGVPITLTDASTGSPSSWTWAMAGGTPTNAITQNTSVTYTTAGVKTITLTVANGTGTTTATKSITITATPTVATSITNTTICSGNSVVVNLTGATTYTWLPSGSGTTSTLSPTSTTIYTVTGSNGGCTSAPKNFTITVNTSPTVAVTASSASLCAGQSATLTASGATTYAWLPGSQTTTVIAVTPTTNTTYTVTGSNGTCSSSKTISINVSTTPTVATSITNTTICSGSTVLVSLTGASSYTWSPSGSGSSSTLSPTSTRIYTVTGSNGGCTSTPKNFTITVNTSPTVAVTASSASLCAGQSATLTASGATTYAWLPGSQTTTVVAVTPTTNTTYTVTGSKGTCSSSKTISINVSTTPTVATSITNTTICSGSSVLVSLTGASSYIWSPSGSGSSSTLSPASTTIYTVTGSNGGCIGTSKIFTINTTPSPTVTSIASPSLICTGQSATLTVSGATNYTWTPSATLSSANGSAVVANPTTTTVYTVIGSNGTCNSNSSISLTVSACTGIENLATPETISIYPNPNNGVFTISTSTSIESLNITIINALGQTVKTETIKNSNQTIIDISMMSKGVYYLKAKTNEGTRLFKVILE